jgi:XTP/dITP diphosphohydrolase
MKNSDESAFPQLVRIMDELREQCPWDRKQTLASLRQLTLEETYELAEAITEGDWAGLKEELGDLLLHIVFYARIASEQEKFHIGDVIQGICAKLIARHPHVYGTAENAGQPIHVRDDEEVKQNWEKLKLKEGKRSVIAGVPVALPSLVKAMRLQEKAKQVGFEWDDREQVWEKVEEEMNELKEAVRGGDETKMEEELGDLFFSLVNYARFLRVDPDNALERTNKKFIDRFTRMEQEALNRGKELSRMTLEEMDAIWNEIKHRRHDS